MRSEIVIWIAVSCVICLCGISSIVAAQVDDDTVALWLFDEGGGDVAKDLSGKGNDGKAIEVEWVPGKFGGAVRLDGIAGKADYIEVPGSASLDISEQLTIEVWVNINEHQPDHIRIITGYNAATNAGYSLLLSNVGQVKTFLHVNGGWKIYTGGTIIPEGEWTHLALTFDGATIKLYVNGEVDSEGAAVGKITPRGLDVLYIGRFSAADPETPDGMIDEIRISSVARTQEEIKETMNGLVGLPVEPLDKLATNWGSLKSEY